MQFRALPGGAVLSKCAIAWTTRRELKSRWVPEAQSNTAGTWDSLLNRSKMYAASPRDYAVPESFFSSLKKEWINKRISKIQELAIVDMVDYVDTSYS
jgi:hypothetical protein